MTTDIAAPIAELRELVVAGGIILRPGDTIFLTKVLAHVGDAGVAADALLQWPRPAWLFDLIGTDVMRTTS
jgi:hypothetical protein